MRRASPSLSPWNPYQTHLHSIRSIASSTSQTSKAAHLASSCLLLALKTSVNARASRDVLGWMTSLASSSRRSETLLNRTTSSRSKRRTNLPPAPAPARILFSHALLPLRIVSSCANPLPHLPTLPKSLLTLFQTSARLLDRLQPSQRSSRGARHSSSALRSALLASDAASSTSILPVQTQSEATFALTI